MVLLDYLVSDKYCIIQSHCLDHHKEQANYAYGIDAELQGKHEIITTPPIILVLFNSSCRNHVNQL